MAWGSRISLLPKFQDLSVEEPEFESTDPERFQDFRPVGFLGFLGF